MEWIVNSKRMREWEPKKWIGAVFARALDYRDFETAWQVISHVMTITGPTYINFNLLEAH